MAGIENCNTLAEIADFLNLKDIMSDIEKIKERSLQVNAELILPLVGEFSSGKTTLINALADNKELETANKPTTATIYRIHFGCDKCHAIVLNANGEVEEIENIADLKNETLTDATMVDVFDTSTRVPSTTILVDTPGLSSSNPRHKKNLVDFLPHSDGVLLVTDINSQVTRSLTDFIGTMQLAKRPIFLVITKCDTKSPQEWEQTKKYYIENTKLPIQQIVCVSATNNYLQELYDLFKNIQKEKNNIIKQVDEHRIKNIVKIMLQRIDDMLKSSSSGEELENAISQQEYNLQKLHRNIDKLVEETQSDIEEKGRIITRKFEDIIFDKLDALVAGKSDNFDAEAVSSINTTTSLLIKKYRMEIQSIFQNKARERRNTDNAISLRSLEELDLSFLSVDGLTCDLNLNSLGHQYDSEIAKITKGALVIGAIALTAATAGAAAPAVAGGVGATGTTTAAGGAAVAGTTVATGAAIVAYDEDLGLVESMVGFITDKTMGKPQRQRAIHNYMDESLIPCFKKEINRNNQQLVFLIKDTLYQEAADEIAQKKTFLERLRMEYEEQQEVYNKKKAQLRDYKNELITL